MPLERPVMGAARPGMRGLLSAGRQPAILAHGMGTPTAVILAVLVLLIGVSVATGWDEDSGGAHSASAHSAPIGTIEARVERLRDLTFKTRPVPQTVTPAQARREGLAD